MILIIFYINFRLNEYIRLFNINNNIQLNHYFPIKKLSYLINDTIIN